MLRNQEKIIGKVGSAGPAQSLGMLLVVRVAGIRVLVRLLLTPAMVRGVDF